MYYSLWLNCEGFYFEKGHMDAKKIYLTKEGLGELKKEYEELIKVKRPDILDRVSQARSMGDLSENAEYVAAREDLSFIDGRVDELEELIKQAVLIQESHAKSNHVVKLGSTVTVHLKGKKEVFTFHFSTRSLWGPANFGKNTVV